MSAASWPLQRVPGLLTAHMGSMILGLISPATLKGTIGWHENIKTIGDSKNLLEEVWLVLDPGSSVWIPYGWGSVCIGLDAQRPTKLVAHKGKHGGTRTLASGKQLLW